MKRNKKLISLIIALTFVLSLAVPMAAGAATVQDNSAAKLNGMGIIEGYPDGSFGLDKTITRAEFAKVAVTSAGLQAAEPLMKNTPSQFSDVKTGEWYTGWINLAAAKGFVKGDPAGTFRPNDNISYAEVLTVLLRILGYNDNLTGDWPVDYITMAVELGITDSVSFDAKAPAVRGDVFVLTSESMDEDWVKYDKDTDSFDSQNEKLVEKNFKGGTSSTPLVLDWEVDTVTGTAKIQTFSGTFTGNTPDTAWQTLKSSAVLVGASHVSGLANKYVNLIVKDNKVVYAEVKDYGTLTDIESDYTNTGKTDYAKATIAGTKITSESKDYSLSSLAIVDGTLYSNADPTVEGQKITMVKDKDGNIGMVKSSTSSVPAIVKNVTASPLRISTSGSTTTTNLNDANANLNKSDTTNIAFKGGKVVDLTSLEADDLVTISKDSNGYDYKVTVSGSKVSGTLQSAQFDGVPNVKKIKVGDTNYDIATTGAAIRAQISTNGGTSFSTLVGNDDKLDDFYGKSITLYLNGNGDVEYIVGDDTAGSAASYGLINTINYTYSGNPVAVSGLSSVKILKPDGSKTTYSFGSDATVKNTAGTGYDFDTTNATNAIEIDQLAKYSLNDDGTIEVLEALGAADSSVADNLTDVDTKYDRVLYKGTWYSITSDTVIFHKADSNSALDKQAVGTWSDLENFLDEDGTNAYAKVSGNKVQYITVADALSTGSAYGLVTEAGTDVDGKYLKINKEGTVSRYDNDTADNDAAAKQFMSFTASGSDLVAGATDISVTASVYEIASIDLDNKAVKITDGTNSSWFYFSNDTVVYSLDSTSAAMDIDSLNVGDRLATPGTIIGAGVDNMSDANSVLNFVVVDNP